MTQPPVNPSLFHIHAHDGHTHTHLSHDVSQLPTPRLHLRGVILPDGEERDLWIHDGVLSCAPVAGAQTVATGCWIVPGLVDAHCHIGVREGNGPHCNEKEQEDQAIRDRDAGILLIRDAGSPVDTRWIDDRADLPRMIRAGRHIARPKRYIRDLSIDVEPEDLAAQVRIEAAKGDGWVKIVGDWIDRSVGDLAPLWDEPTARAAVQAAHECGVKMTAHCFAEESVRILVDAGIDGIEHGTGITDDVIQKMADQKVALVPTMINLEKFPGFADAGEAKFPTYAAHMRDLHARRFETMGKAMEAGVPIYAGTDSGGQIQHGSLPGEIALLSKIGGAEFALGAASWRAREWLGHRNIEDGAAADLVIYDEDPRLDPTTPKRPAFVVLRGRVFRRG